MPQIMAVRSYHSLHRLPRVTARVLDFTRILKRLSQLDIMELMSQVEILWIREAQDTLVIDRNFESWRKQLGMFLDSDGVWMCGGRLSNARIPYSAKHPVILPRGHTFITLVVGRAHERVLHNGVRETRAELRTKYWLIKGRSFMKQVVHCCVTCRRFEALSYRAPAPPPLPPFQVEEESPFTFTGVDFASPLHIKSPMTVCNGKSLDMFVHMLRRPSHTPRACPSPVCSAIPSVFHEIFITKRASTQAHFQ